MGTKICQFVLLHNKLLPINKQQMISWVLKEHAREICKKGYDEDY